MRRLLASSVFLFLFALSAWSQTNALWFPVGEEMRYDIHWGVLPVAQTQVTTAWTNLAGRPLIAIRYVTRTNKIVARIYPVDDLLETLIDPETFLPVRFIKKTREGKQRADEVTFFDYEKGEARWESHLKNKKKVLPIAAGTRDLISLMYWLRREPFVLGKEQAHRVFADNKVYDLTLRVTQAEAVSLGAYGKTDCLRVDPEAAFDGLFVRKGRLVVWISTDARQLCAKIEGEVPVARIHITLAQVKGPGSDRWVAAPASPAKGEDP